MSREHAAQLRKTMTDAERRLWTQLRRKQISGTRLRRQVPIGRFIADFFCHAAQIIIEVDGGQHGEPTGIASDAERTHWFEQRGIKVLRFWNHDVMRDTDAIVRTIEAEVEVALEKWRS